MLRLQLSFLLLCSKRSMPAADGAGGNETTTRPAYLLLSKYIWISLIATVELLGLQLVRYPSALWPATTLRYIIRCGLLYDSCMVFRKGNLNGGDITIFVGYYSFMKGHRAKLYSAFANTIRLPLQATMLPWFVTLI